MDEMGKYAVNTPLLKGDGHITNQTKKPVIDQGRTGSAGKNHA